MKHHSAKRCISPVAMLLLVLAMMGTASAKSLYVVANIDPNYVSINAWNVNPNGTVVYQKSYKPLYAIEPVGMAVDADSGTLFVTAERASGFEMVDAVTMKSRGYADLEGEELAGIDVDDKHNIIYTVLRSRTPSSKCRIRAYNYDPNKISINTADPNCLDPNCTDPKCVITTQAVTMRAGYPKTLLGCKGAFGITLDETHDMIYVADSVAGKVRGYAINESSDPNWPQAMRFTPSVIPAGIAVDRRRGFIYTTAPDKIVDPADPVNSGSCIDDGGLFDNCLDPNNCPGFTKISKYNLATGEESVMDIGHGGTGIAVEEITGYVYVAGGCSADDISIWDTSTYTPAHPYFTRVQATYKIGNPTGIVAENVSYNPVILDIFEKACVEADKDATYTISFGNTGKDFYVTDAVIEDKLPAETTFVSANDGGIYNSITHTVSWNIGELSDETPQRTLQLVVHVSPAIDPNSTVIDYATITYTTTYPPDDIRRVPITITNERKVCCQPSVTPPDAKCKDITVQLDASGNIKISPADVDDGSTNDCGIADFSVSSNTFTCDNIGPNHVTFTVTDTSGNKSTCESTVTVAGPPPVAKCKAPFTVTLDASGKATISADDVDGGSYVICGTLSKSIDVSTFTCADIARSPIPVTLTVSDGINPPVFCVTEVTVRDDIAPEVVYCPDPNTVTGACGSASPVSWDEPVFKDNCPVTVTNIAVYPDGSSRDNVKPGDPFPVGETKITYTAADNSGNTATCTFTVTVEGGGVIEVKDCPSDITGKNDTGECRAKVFWTPPTFTGGCGTLTVTSNHNPGDFFPAECEATAQGTEVTYTATDSYGNTKTWTRRNICSEL